MNIIKAAVERPRAVFAAIIIIVMLGLIALNRIPIQLSPDVRKPVISIETVWPGASPMEVEREIIIPQEDKLRGIQGLENMLSRSYDGRGEIELTFSIGQDMGSILLLVSNRLDQVEDYPDEVDKPSMEAAGSEDSPIAWILLIRNPGNIEPIHHYGDFATDVIKERLERLKGIAKSNVYGGSERELRVTIDASSLAFHRLSIRAVLNRLRANNLSVSAGDVEEGKRRYIVRSEGELNTPERVRQVILSSVTDPQTGRITHIRVADIAKVAMAYKEPTTTIRALGHPAIAINAIRTTGSNVIETMESLRQVIDELNATVLPARQLHLRQVYDETVYINSAIDLVVQNIYVGGALAALVMLLFLKSFSTTLIASLAIPISVIATFVAMSLMGRSLNVISLAGIAFAVGMVVDATIVVIENIFRLRYEKGLSRLEAAIQGAHQVWAAILVSALTTVTVFIPILFMELEVGQLFRDIAVAISVSVLVSLLVAITFIPSLARNILPTKRQKTPFFLKIFDRFGQAWATRILAINRSSLNNQRLAIGLTGSLIIGAMVVFALFLPKLEYLPEGNRNLIFGAILPPPGYNLAAVSSLGKSIEAAVSPYWIDLDQSEVQVELSPDQPPLIDNFFFVSTDKQTFLGASSADPKRVRELIPVLSGPAFAEPGTFGFISQPSLFSRSLGSGRTIDIDISGPDLVTIFQIAAAGAGLIQAALPMSQGNQLRPRPGLELGSPQIDIIPNLRLLADAGMSAGDLGLSVRALNQGVRVAEITSQGEKIDLTLRGPEQYIRQTQKIGDLPIATPTGTIVPVRNLADVVLKSGPVQIRRLEKLRTVTLEVSPSPAIALEEAITILNNQVVLPLRQKYDNVRVNLSGTADELTKTWNAIVFDLLVALAVIYLLMAVLFNSFFYPLIIMTSVPVAMAGGALGLGLVNLSTNQPLDMLTLLGFVILTGIVVNNAILLVDRALSSAQRMPIPAAVMDAVSNRLRPIFMSTLTSLFGMLPLVVFPGAGSELYRGLGSVVLGGLALSSVLTLLMVPPMLSLWMPIIEKKRSFRS